MQRPGVFIGILLPIVFGITTLPLTTIAIKLSIDSFGSIWSASTPTPTEEPESELGLDLDPGPNPIRYTLFITPYYPCDTHLGAVFVSSREVDVPVTTFQAFVHSTLKLSGLELESQAETVAEDPHGIFMDNGNERPNSSLGGTHLYHVRFKITTFPFEVRSPNQYFSQDDTCEVEINLVSNSNSVRSILLWMGLIWGFNLICVAHIVFDINRFPSWITQVALFMLYSLLVWCIQLILIPHSLRLQIINTALQLGRETITSFNEAMESLNYFP